MPLKRILVLIAVALTLSACSNEGSYTSFGTKDSPSKPPPRPGSPGLKGYKVIEQSMLTPTTAFTEDGQTRSTGYSGTLGISSTTRKLTKVSGYEVYQQVKF